MVLAKTRTFINHPKAREAVQTSQLDQRCRAVETLLTFRSTLENELENQDADPEGTALESIVKNCRKVGWEMKKREED